MTVNRLYAGAGGAPVHFPDDLFPTDGFCGIHDDPKARVLLLKSNMQTAIVALELVMLPPDGIDAVKNAVREITQTDIQNIWVHTTHAITTPHAPHAPMGMGGVPLEIPDSERIALDKKRSVYMAALLDAAVKAAEAAVKAFRPARMGIGTGTSRINTNRDIETPHGWWIGFNPDGPSNHTATVLRFDGEDGSLIGSLISFGIKPCAIDNSEMDKETRLISSDVPGTACKLLERHPGGFPYWP